MLTESFKMETISHSDDLPEMALRRSEDGSSTLYRADLDEHYHSFHGAIQESRHVFMEAGLKALAPKGDFSVLEVGFGTGLNALLTLCEKPEGTRVYYRAIEKYPVPKALSAQINYPGLLGGPEVLDWFRAMHNAEWNADVGVHPEFVLHKHLGALEDFKTAQRFDLLYFDAFAPDKQPELWSTNIFAALFACLKPGGIMTTYSAKGAVRRSLQEVGFEVERLPGPPGKRQMLRARKVG